MKTAGTAFLCLALAGPLVAEGDISPVFQGRTSSELSEQAPTYSVQAESGGEASAFGLRARIVGGIAGEQGRTFGTLSDAWLSWGGDFASTQLGWWPEPTGPALFHSLVPAFASPPATEFLTSAGSVRPRSPAKFALKGTWQEWSLSLEVAPWQSAVEAPDPSSPWFPRKDVPTEFTNAFLGTYLLHTLSMAKSSDPTWTGTVPIRASARWSALWGETSLGYFHGWDDSAVFPYSVTIPTAFEFDIELTPLRNVVDAGWLTLEVPLGSGKFWAEQRMTRNRLRLEGGLGAIANGSFAQTTSSTTAWEAVAGASDSFSWGGWGTLRLWTEGNVYRDERAPWGEAPDFSQGVEAGAHWDFPRETGSIDVMAGSPWDAYQGWLWAKASWDWTEGRSLWLGMPWFWGASDSAWGQYSNRRLLAAGTTWNQ